MSSHKAKLRPTWYLRACKFTTAVIDQSLLDLEQNIGEESINAARNSSLSPKKAMSNSAYLAGLSNELLTSIVRQIFEVYYSNVGIFRLSACDHDTCPDDCNGTKYHCRTVTEGQCKPLTSLMGVNRHLRAVTTTFIQAEKRRGGTTIGEVKEDIGYFYTFNAWHIGFFSVLPAAGYPLRLRESVTDVVLDSRLRIGPAITTQVFRHVEQITVLLGITDNTVDLSHEAGSSNGTLSDSVLLALLNSYDIDKHLADNQYIQDLIKGDVPVQGKAVIRYIGDDGKEVILHVYLDLKNRDITSEKLEGPLFAHENQAEYGRVLHY